MFRHIRRLNRLTQQVILYTKLNSDFAWLEVEFYPRTENLRLPLDEALTLVEAV